MIFLPNYRKYVINSFIRIKNVICFCSCHVPDLPSKNGGVYSVEKGRGFKLGKGDGLRDDMGSEGTYVTSVTC